MIPEVMSKYIIYAYFIIYLLLCQKSDYSNVLGLGSHKTWCLFSFVGFVSIKSNKNMGTYQ